MEEPGAELRGLGVRIKGAVIAQHLDAQAEHPTVVGHG